MSVSSNAVKVTAKTALKCNFFNGMISSLILIFTFLLCSNIAGALSLVIGDIAAEILFFIMAVLLLFPIGLGVLRYIWRMLFSAKDSPLYTFYWFSSKELYLRALKFIAQLVVRIVFWIAVTNIPSILLFVLSKNYIFELFDSSMPIWTANLGYYSIVLRNISFVAVFFIMLKFYLAPVLFVADDNMDCNEALYISSVISRKTSLDFIGLIFSSIGWIALSVFILPLPFTLPLLLSYYAVHTRFSVAEYNRHIEERVNSVGFIWQ